MRLLAPRHLLDRAACRRPIANTVPLNSRSSGISPSSRPVKYLVDADFKVVGEQDRQVDLGTAGESGHHRGHGRELHRLERVGPAGGVAEQVVEPLGLVRRVAAPGGLDPDLAAQRDRVDPLAGGFRDSQDSATSTARRRTCRAGTDAVEDQFRHVRLPGLGARAWPGSGPCRGTRRCWPWPREPPSKPAPVQAHPAGQFVAGVDRDDEASTAEPLASRAGDQDGLDVGFGLRRAAGARRRARSQACRSSRHSVAPAGLG